MNCTSSRPERFRKERRVAQRGNLAALRSTTESCLSGCYGWPRKRFTRRQCLSTFVSYQELSIPGRGVCFGISANYWAASPPTYHTNHVSFTAFESCTALQANRAMPFPRTLVVGHAAQISADEPAAYPRNPLPAPNQKSQVSALGALARIRLDSSYIGRGGAVCEDLAGAQTAIRCRHPQKEGGARVLENERGTNVVYESRFQKL